MGSKSQANVLIEVHGEKLKAVLADAGLKCITKRQPISVVNTSFTHDDVRWMAPEVYVAECPQPTAQGDIYSFAMTIYEVNLSTCL